jgi:hypothetical protein
MRKLFYRCVFAAGWFLLACTKQASAFAILTHEAIIDASWEKNIKPLLLQRFPASADSVVKNAHAYAYGGAMIDDTGHGRRCPRYK